MTKMKNDTPLVVVGKKTQYMNFIKVQIKKINFNPDKIIFLNDVSIQDLPGIYQLSTLFIYPSFFEGFGIPIIEALNSKVPVITSKEGCFKEAGGEKSIYINPNDVEEIAFNIDECLEDSLKREEMINSGLSHVKNFNPEIISKKLINAYSNLLQ